MATSLNSVADIVQAVTTPEYMEEGFYVFMDIRTPSEDRYRSTLEALGYEGDIGTTPDRNGNVQTMFTTDDNQISVNVHYQGPKPEKPEKDDDSEPSEGESDLEG